MYKNGSLSVFQTYSFVHFYGFSIRHFYLIDCSLEKSTIIFSFLLSGLLPQYFNGEQHDSQEFISSLLEVLDVDFVKNLFGFVIQNESMFFKLTITF